jgi:murein DD-endopeptidase MepM/ murein hydrolase activator NlpD
VAPTGISKVSIPSRIPVDGFRLTSEYGMRVHPVLGGRRAHKGIDLATPTGTPVHAPADGVVGKAEWFSSYGLYIQIEHGGELQTRYGHLSRLNVASGQFVHKGDVIGYVGTTGRSTGPHLHYEVRVAGVSVNPMPYMQEGGAGASAPQLAMATAMHD